VIKIPYPLSYSKEFFDFIWENNLYQESSIYDEDIVMFIQLLSIDFRKRGIQSRLTDLIVPLSWKTQIDKRLRNAFIFGEAENQKAFYPNLTVMGVRIHFSFENYYIGMDCRELEINSPNQVIRGSIGEAISN
jgi:hypothetical protein